jgi:hypothetical protein
MPTGVAQVLYIAYVDPSTISEDVTLIASSIDDAFPSTNAVGTIVVIIWMQESFLIVCANPLCE